MQVACGAPDGGIPRLQKMLSVSDYKWHALCLPKPGRGCSRRSGTSTFAVNYKATELVTDLPRLADADSSKWARQTWLRRRCKGSFEAPAMAFPVVVTGNNHSNL